MPKSYSALPCHELNNPLLRVWWSGAGHDIRSTEIQKLSIRHETDSRLKARTAGIHFQMHLLLMLNLFPSRSRAQPMYMPPCALGGCL